MFYYIFETCVTEEETLLSYRLEYIIYAILVIYSL